MRSSSAAGSPLTASARTSSMCCTCVRVLLPAAALLLVCGAGAALAQPPGSAHCSIAGRIPGEFDVYHVGNYQGTSELGAFIELDNSGNSVKKLDVLVNLPGKAIVLVLTAYDPVVWNVAWTSGTRIVGAM